MIAAEGIDRRRRLLMEDDVRVTTPLMGWKAAPPSFYILLEDAPLPRSSRHWAWLTTPALLLLLLLVPLLLIELLLPYYAVTLCAPPQVLRGHAVDSAAATTIGPSDPRQVDGVLVLADVHIASFCPFGDVGMRQRRIAAQRVHALSTTAVLGDVMSFGGGEDGTYNVSDALFDFHARRFQRILGCTAVDMRNPDRSRCLILPGNHDLVHEPTARWLRWFPAANSLGRLPGGTSFYALNSQNASIPAGASATLLLSHSAVTHERWGLMFNANVSTLPVNAFRLILSGNEHVAAFNPATVLGAVPSNRTHPAEVVVPSFNAFRAMLDSTPTICSDKPNCRPGVGFGVLRVFDDESISYQLCSPTTSPYPIYAMWALMAALVAWRCQCLLTVSASTLSLLGASFLFLYFPITALV